MEVSLPAPHRLSRRASGGNEFFQESAGALGKGPDTDRDQIVASDHEEQIVLEDQDGGVLSSHSEYRLSVDDCAFVSFAAGDDCAIQSGLVSDAVYRLAALACFDG